VNTSFREANLGLKVKPTVLQDGYVILDVGVTNDSVDQSTTSTSGLLINKQSITTNLFLEDKVTVVIGGILQQNKSHANSKVPGLGDIPLLGNLFKNSDKYNDQTELMVFITPRVVNMNQKQNNGTAAKEPAPSGSPFENHKEEPLGAEEPAKTPQGNTTSPQ
jgi:type IV pilus assembly protein PilQ